jgi:hypothetical protein
MLTVGELIGLLQKFPFGYRVVVPGYEFGFSDVGDPQKIELNLNVHTAEDWFAGAHEEAEGGSPAVLIASPSTEPEDVK